MRTAASERRVAGVVLLLLATLTLAEAWRLSALREEMVAGAVVGDDTFPLIVGVALLALGAYVLLFARWPAARVEFAGGRPRRQLVASAGALVAYYVVTPYLGYTLGTLVVSTALYRAMGGYRWWVAAAIGVATTGALYLAFRVWLLQPLPTGWLGI
jgi:putative tricarboxylic transport membrane protein